MEGTFRSENELGTGWTTMDDEMEHKPEKVSDCSKENQKSPRKHCGWITDCSKENHKENTNVVEPVKQDGEEEKTGLEEKPEKALRLDEQKIAEEVRVSWIPPAGWSTGWD